jgi:hypothetical protein
MSIEQRRAEELDRDYVMEEEPGGIDVFGFVQRHWGRFASATVAVGLLGAAAAAVSMALPAKDRSVSMDITPTFPGAREGRYPNRAPFSPQDIVATSVAEPVWRAQGLVEVIPLPDLCRNLQIMSGGADLDMVRAEYQQKLSNTKLTAAERSALEAEYASKLKAIGSASLTLTLSSAGDALTSEQMVSFLGALPVEWARASDVAGARAYDFPLPNGAELRVSAQHLADPKSSAADAVRHAERMKEFIDALAETISEMRKLPGSDGIKDAKGASVVDLGQEITSMRRNLVIPAYLDMLEEARARDPEGYAAIRSTRRKLLESELANARERARVLREAYDAYADETRMVRRVGDPTSDDPRQAGVLANVDGTFIDRVIEQAVKSRDVEYRRELTDRRLTAELDVVDRTAKLEFEEWLETTVEGRSSDATPAGAGVTRLQGLTENLAAYADRTREIMAVLAARNLNSTSTMYRVDMDAAVRTTPMLPLRTVALGAFAAWAAAMAWVTVRAAAADRRAARWTSRLGGPAAAAMHELVSAAPPRRIEAPAREPVA